MRSIILLVVFSVTFLTNAQEVIAGKVKDSISGSVLPYVNIGIAGKSAGTVSDKEGNFKLKLNNLINDNDEVTFESAGFKTVTYKVSSLKERSIIELQTESEILEEVVIDLKKGKLQKLGKKNLGLDLTHFSFYSSYEHDVVDDALSKETGMLFKLKKDYWVNSLNFKISSNEYKHLKFRINFYKIEDGVPGEQLFATKNIIFKVENNYTGWFNVDIRDYDVFLEKELGEVAVTIQWLESEKNNDKSKFLSIPVSLTGGTQFIRNKTMDRWQKSKQTLSFYVDVAESVH